MIAGRNNVLRSCLNAKRVPAAVSSLRSLSAIPGHDAQNDEMIPEELPLLERNVYSSPLQPHQVDLVKQIQFDLGAKQHGGGTLNEFSALNAAGDPMTQTKKSILEPHQVDLVKQIDLEHDLKEDGRTLKEYIETEQKKKDEVRHHMFE